MKWIIWILATIFFLVPAVGFSDTLGAPLCTQDEAWQAVVDNAYQIAEEYAIANNPRSTFETSIKDYKFVKQAGGSYEGKYLLIITTDHGKDYNTAILLPLFDVNKPSYDLNTDHPLWQLIRAELNGKSY